MLSQTEFVRGQRAYRVFACDGCGPPAGSTGDSSPRATGARRWPVKERGAGRKARGQRRVFLWVRVWTWARDSRRRQAAGERRPENGRSSRHARFSRRGVRLGRCEHASCLRSRNRAATGRGPPGPQRSKRQPERGQAAGCAVFAILQIERAAVIFSDLAAQEQADARAARLRREERDEQIGGAG